MLHEAGKTMGHFLWSNSDFFSMNLTIFSKFNNYRHFVVVFAAPYMVLTFKSCSLLSTSNTITCKKFANTTYVCISVVRYIYLKCKHGSQREESKGKMHRMQQQQPAGFHSIHSFHPHPRSKCFSS